MNTSDNILPFSDLPAAPAARRKKANESATPAACKIVTPIPSLRLMPPPRPSRAESSEPSAEAARTVLHPLSSGPAEVCLNRAHFEASVDSIIVMQSQVNERKIAMENEMEALRMNHEAALGKLESQLALEKAKAEKWARRNRRSFDEGTSLELPGVTVAFRLNPPKVELKPGQGGWRDVVERMKKLPWAASFLRQPLPPQEVNKQALIASRATLAPGSLRAAGLRIVQEEVFTITPGLVNRPGWEKPMTGWRPKEGLAIPRPFADPTQPAASSAQHSRTHSSTG